MPGYHDFTTTRQTPPDPVALAASVRTATADASAVLACLPSGVWRGKKAAAWTDADIAAVQTALDTATTLTAALGVEAALVAQIAAGLQAHPEIAQGAYYQGTRDALYTQLGQL